ERERAPLAGAQIFAGDASVRDARQAHHRKAGELAEAPHLPVAPFAQSDLEPGLVAFVAQALDLGRLRASALNLDALTEAGQGVVVDGAFDLGHVDLRHLALGVGERLRELTVVRAQERTAGVKVEAPYRHDARAGVFEQLANRGPPFRIAERADDAARLVQHQVHQLLGDNLGPIDLDAALARIHLRPQLPHHAPVDAHPPRPHDLLGTAPRRP